MGFREITLYAKIWLSVAWPRWARTWMYESFFASSCPFLLFLDDPLAWISQKWWSIRFWEFTPKREISENPNFSNSSFLSHWFYLLLSFFPLPQRLIALVLDHLIRNQWLQWLGIWISLCGLILHLPQITLEFDGTELVSDECSQANKEKLGGGRWGP